MSDDDSESQGRSALILMCGRSFSGKSTISRNLAPAIEAEVVSLDLINEERGLFGGQGIPVEEWIRTNEEATQRVSRALSLGRRVVVDDTSSPRFLRDRWRKLATSLGSVFMLVYVNTPVTIARDRLLDNRTNNNRNDVVDHVMAEHLDTFEPPEPDEECTATGSSDAEIEDLIALVRSRIDRRGNSVRLELEEN